MLRFVCKEGWEDCGISHTCMHAEGVRPIGDKSRHGWELWKGVGTNEMKLMAYEIS